MSGQHSPVLDLAALAQFLDEIKMERTQPDYPAHLIGWLPYHDQLRAMLTEALGGAA